ncbi:21240_t:CDS:2, partial [Cetraspora pellucida]
NVTDQEQDNVTDSEYEESTEKTFKRGRKSGMELPVYEPIENYKETHKGYATLPHKMQQSTISPLALFHLFFTDYYLQTIVNNTNNYEKLKRANSLKKGHVWTLLTLKELKIWIAIVIYMGIYKIHGIVDLWNSDEQRAIHNISQFISIYRFQQIKRFLHISNPYKPSLYWYSKIELLALQL